MLASHVQIKLRPNTPLIPYKIATSATATQILKAYLQALLALYATPRVEELSNSAAALQSAFTNYTGNDLELLNRIGIAVPPELPVSPAAMSFAELRLRAYAIRRTMRCASPVLSTLINRLTVIQNNPNTAFDPHQTISTTHPAVSLVQRAEASTRFRRLTFIIRLHATVLADCEQTGPPHDKLRHIITQISNLANALGDQST
ncbi:hypothetical protein SAMN06273572_102589 [Monaibacterium marinum]|uniref:Uncharacterized protein n=1 Tax=Pontivivens marinum TaxID=1690039 RepID=A0A2C9CRT0_9RHOB|nr:hypothetical protein [Monaibacterium marinum]SOH93910.1 hypothetical protein SAMN06273572_102589 [Monaibacterium marinum]